MQSAIALLNHQNTKSLFNCNYHFSQFSFFYECTNLLEFSHHSHLTNILLFYQSIFGLIVCCFQTQPFLPVRQNKRILKSFLITEQKHQLHMFSSLPLPKLSNISFWMCLSKEVLFYFPPQSSSIHPCIQSYSRMPKLKNS